MARTLHLVPGSRWFAGVDLPFFVPTSLVTGAAQDLGFAAIAWHDRDDSLPPVDVRLDAAYSDDWDQWAEGEYRGAERDYVLPYNVPWLVAVNPSAPKAPSSSAPPKDLTLDERAAGLVRVALESRDPATMRSAAAMLRAQGFVQLADQLLEQARTPEPANPDTSSPPAGNTGAQSDAAEEDEETPVGPLSFGAVTALGFALDFLICWWLIKRRKPRKA